ncbi:MAG: hypothetical protein GXY33_09890 [Phycisphaerae bacterium]|nr:hypothetical protein [Phycisphaerae bacterium]
MSRTTRAFTLLEAMLAVSVIILIIGAVYSFYTYSLRLVEAGNRHLQESLVARTVLQQVASEIRSIPGLGTHFGPVLRGEHDRILFISTVNPSRLVFFPRDFMESTVAVEHDLRRVEYRLAESDEEEVLGLRRSELRVLLAPTVEETGDEELAAGEASESVDAAAEVSVDEVMDNVEVAEEQIVAEDIRYLEFQFYNGLGWSSQWEADVLPRAIRIVVGFSEVPEEALRDELMLAWEDRPYREDQYDLVVSLRLSEELKARNAESGGTEGQ